ncbi:hypothetical protein JCM3766R1_000679 [Sporobolomyces carnicolor]
MQAVSRPMRFLSATEKFRARHCRAQTPSDQRSAKGLGRTNARANATRTFFFQLAHSFSHNVVAFSSNVVAGSTLAEKSMTPHAELRGSKLYAALKHDYDQSIDEICSDAVSDSDRDSIGDQIKWSLERTACLEVKSQLSSDAADSIGSHRLVVSENSNPTTVTLTANQTDRLRAKLTRLVTGLDEVLETRPHLDNEKSLCLLTTILSTISIFTRYGPPDPSLIL